MFTAIEKLWRYELKCKYMSVFHLKVTTTGNSIHPIYPWIFSLDNSVEWVDSKENQIYGLSLCPFCLKLNNTCIWSWIKRVKLINRARRLHCTVIGSRDKQFIFFLFFYFSNCYFSIFYDGNIFFWIRFRLKMNQQSFLCIFFQIFSFDQIS